MPILRSSGKRPLYIYIHILYATRVAENIQILRHTSQDVVMVVAWVGQCHQHGWRYILHSWLVLFTFSGAQVALQIGGGSLLRLMTVPSLLYPRVRPLNLQVPKTVSYRIEA